jgi:hypothetical protein
MAVQGGMQPHAHNRMRKYLLARSYRLSVSFILMRRRNQALADQTAAPSRRRPKLCAWLAGLLD